MESQKLILCAIIVAALILSGKSQTNSPTLDFLAQTINPNSTTYPDGSDESHILCETGLGPTVRTTTTSRPIAGCIAPSIPNALLAYEFDDRRIIAPGDILPDMQSIAYKCEKGYNRLGIQYNLCFGSKWQSFPHPQCLKFCKPLNGVTYGTKCKLNGVPVPCDYRIVPGTIARIFCKTRYRKPDRSSLTSSLRCGDDGNWDYEPYRCEPVCGEELPQVTQLVVNGEPTNITEVPWHVGIYNNYQISGQYAHHCGGTILSAKVVVSAARCFWNSEKKTVFDESIFLVGAGKSKRDYYIEEDGAQFQNISKIVVPDQFNVSNQDSQGDIAVLILTKYFIFSSHIAPICIDWKDKADQAIASNTYGRLVGWGIDETGELGKDLRSAYMPATSHVDCKKEARMRFYRHVANDEFCFFHRHSQIICRGDRGGGFTVKEVVGEKNVYFLWGVISFGTLCKVNDSRLGYHSCTNIHYHRTLVENLLIMNSVK